MIRRLTEIPARDYVTGCQRPKPRTTAQRRRTARAVARQKGLRLHTRRTRAQYRAAALATWDKRKNRPPYGPGPVGGPSPPLEP